MLSVTVRQKIDDLFSEPSAGDPRYSADQFVGTAMRGLQLLADEIDEIKARIALPVEPTAAEESNDLGTQLDELTAQLKKLTKTLKKASKKN